MKIALLGAGAMGSAIGALLQKAGNQVSLTVLSLQNGWGNGPRIAGIVGKERVHA